MNSIIEFQHKILRKYTMLGMIQYSDAPFFHDMVDKNDYKMISIFEVFAINRNEDDFLENLGLYAQLILEHDEEHQEETPVPREPENENITLLKDYQSEFSAEEFEKLKNHILEETKMIMTAIKIFKLNKDSKDMVHTMRLFLKKN